MTPQLLLRVEHLVVHLKFERPFAASNKRKFINDVLVVAQNIIRHTDGTRCIVSRHAIFKRNRIFFFHRVTSIGRLCCKNEG